MITEQRDVGALSKRFLIAILLIMLLPLEGNHHINSGLAQNPGGQSSVDRIPACEDSKSVQFHEMSSTDKFDISYIIPIETPDIDSLSKDAPMSTESVKPEPLTTELLISFAGDCTIGTDESFSYVNSFPYRFEKVGGDFSYFFKSVQPVFEADDLTLVNLETTLTRAEKKADKKFRFKGDPSYVQILKEGSIEMVNISNNHIYDYLNAGFKETLKTLENAGIHYSGEGIIAYYPVKDLTVASIGYNGWSTVIKKSLAADIKAAGEKADIIIVSFHWGQEYSFYPNSTQMELGRFAVEQGADIVVGHHPHVVQGIELYKGKFIVYSLGNFCFGGNRNPRDKDTFIFQNRFLFEDKKLKESRGMIIPCSLSSVDYVNDFQPTVLSGAEKDRVAERLFEYSRELKYGIKPNDVYIP
jgi:poly-gamma-glutamate capsule biosynthesis protein CapA/YwtB (metallophosphatase superfamily)